MKILSLDFDGVLHRYDSGWKGPREIPDPPVDGGLEFLLAAMERFDVAIHSSRSRYFGGRRAMKRWLIRHLEEYFWSLYSNGGRAYGGYTTLDVEEQIASSARATVARLAFPLWKPPAHVTLDDRALTFTGTWPDLGELLEFIPWNKRPPAEPHV